MHRHLSKTINRRHDPTRPVNTMVDPMTHPINRRRAIGVGVGLAWGCTLSTPAARACEFITSSLTVVHPWTRATVENASTAKVCMAFKDVVDSDRLVAAHTPVAERVHMGGTGSDTTIDFWIAAGQESALTEEGAHLILVGLAFPLGLGASYPLSLVFEKAGPIEARLTVDYARFRFR